MNVYRIVISDAAKIGTFSDYSKLLGSFLQFFYLKEHFFQNFLYLCNQVLADGRKRPKYNLFPECRVAVCFLRVNELAFAISSCLRNVENFNRQVAFATQKKDEVSARAIAWADLILCCRQFPRPRRG